MNCHNTVQNPFGLFVRTECGFTLAVMGGRSLVGRQDRIFSGKHHSGALHSYLAAEKALERFWLCPPIFNSHVEKITSFSRVFR
jgi:hypothetical protein